jgi:hypothetical protein
MCSARAPNTTREGACAPHSISTPNSYSTRERVATMQPPERTAELGMTLAVLRDSFLFAQTLALKRGAIIKCPCETMTK